MEADPDAGIIQSLPLIVNRNTMFARVQQFAARIAGPVIAAGLTLWMGRDGNYWGHNAIIRTRAFADHCGMPDLRGRPPFGGHILSHDFVEAALMRRAGYAVYMLPDARRQLRGKPALADRPRRARQTMVPGQSPAYAHPRRARGFMLASRQHFANGIMGYLASPLWMAQLIVGIVLVLQSNYIRPEYFTADFSLFPAWPRFDYERALRLFELTIVILLAPKFLGMDRADRPKDAPRLRRRRGALVSTSSKSSFPPHSRPIMMLIQSGSVAQILSGRDTGWNPQRRDDGSIPLQQHRASPPRAYRVRRHNAGRGHADLPLPRHLDVADDRRPDPGDSVVLGERQLCDRRRLAQGRSADDARGNPPPPIIARANALAAELGRTGHDEEDGLRAIGADPNFRPRARGLPAGGRAAAARRNRCRGGRRHRQAQRRPFARRGRHLAETTGTTGRPQRSGADRRCSLRLPNAAAQANATAQPNAA